MAQSSASGTSSRRHMREHDMPASSSRYVDGEWETKEALLQRELEEARSRAAQMEKTMRWWSDCTANWREKWSKVRNERNKAREEAKALRAKFEFAVKDANALKYEYQEMELQNEQLKKEMEKIHTILLKYAGRFDQQIISILESDPELKNALGIDELLEVYNNVDRGEAVVARKSPTTENVALDSVPNRDIEEYVLQGVVPKHAVELYKEDSLDQSVTKSSDKSEQRQSSMEVENEEFLMQKMSILYSRLEEANSAVEIEREEKIVLEQTVEKLRSEVSKMQEKCRELQESKAELTKELLNVKSRLDYESKDAKNDLVDETANREGMDRRLSELCIELERLQAENATEWGKRERLETEKISLERTNKQLRSEIRELQERIDSRRVRPVSICDADTRILQQELLDRNKELIELKHSHAKLKKVLAEKTTELSHAMRRSEQYEAEVKRVRARVEELKKELAAAQDEVDTVTSSVRKLQRMNDDLIEQLESANMQLGHLRNSPDTYTANTVTEATDNKHREDEDLTEGTSFH